MPPLPVDLPKITSSLRQLLDRVLSPGLNGTGERRVLSPEEMNAILSCLMRAGQWLQSLSSDRRISLGQEIDEYRAELRRLHALLPSIHSALLAQRARLEAERERLRKADEWMQASRQTL